MIIMPNLEVLKHQIDTIEDLQSVVKTMKALAAVSIRQYEKSVISLIDYNRTLEMGLQILLRQSPEVLLLENSLLMNRVAIVVFGSDQGMCGQFNEKIAKFTQEQLQSPTLNSCHSKILTVGSRITDRLAFLGYNSEESLSLPSSIEGISSIVQETVLILDNWRQKSEINQILAFNNYVTSGAGYSPHQVQIFPLNMSRLKNLQRKKWESRSLPIFTIASDSLASALFRQHFFISLYRACAESLASENASRLASMQIAEKNIEEKLGELKTSFHQERQNVITEELLDIVSGFEALTNEQD
jgi:F-type H+-transporting ATPase subunit gamma